MNYPDHQLTTQDFPLTAAQSVRFHEMVDYLETARGRFGADPEVLDGVFFEAIDKAHRRETIDTPVRDKLLWQFNLND